MKRVIVESPFAGTHEERKANITYLRRCLRDCLQRGEAPFASHAIYTQHGVLEDDVPGERKLGIEAGFRWGDVADYVVVYVDRGVSKGMNEGVARALRANQPVLFRSLDGADLADYPPLAVPVPTSPIPTEPK